MQISKMSGLATAAQDTEEAAGTGHTKEKKSFADVLSELNDYVKGTPAQQMEKQVLAKLGVTEKELKAMSPEERNKVMEQVREMIKQQLTAQEQSQAEKKTVI